MTVNISIGHLIDRVVIVAHDGKAETGEIEKQVTLALKNAVKATLEEFSQEKGLENHE
jgi:hypothetical protein